MRTYVNVTDFRGKFDFELSFLLSEKLIYFAPGGVIVSRKSGRKIFLIELESLIMWVRRKMITPAL